MRLLNCETLKLEDHHGESTPNYAILSHTWEQEEILFDDIQHEPPHWRHKKGAQKVLGSVAEARRLHFSYIWIDTCCIDKSSSAELSEAINSMFNWYLRSSVCIAYLSDVYTSSMYSFVRSKWFTRGWTLQELIAPWEARFYCNDWEYLGDRASLVSEIVMATSIDRRLLQLSRSEPLPATSTPSGAQEFKLGTLYSYSISERMKWASRRQTKRPEDMAYCLMGLFDIHMPLLYGEGGEKAFFRLQEAILKGTDDHSVLCFSTKNEHVSSTLVLASSPSLFNSSLQISPVRIAPFFHDPNRPDFHLNIGKRNELHIGILLVPAIRRHVRGHHFESDDIVLSHHNFTLEGFRREDEFLGGKLVAGILNCEIHKGPGSNPTRPVLILREHRGTFAFERTPSAMGGSRRLYELQHTSDLSNTTARPILDQSSNQVQSTNLSWSE